MLLAVAQSRSLHCVQDESPDESCDESHDESHDDSRDDSHDESHDEIGCCDRPTLLWENDEKFPTGNRKRKEKREKRKEKEKENVQLKRSLSRLLIKNIFV